MPQADDRETRRDAEWRQVVYEEFHEFHETTKSIRAVTARPGIDRRAVRKYLDVLQCPRPKPRGKRPSILDYIIVRWGGGCRYAAELYREIARQGYPGSRSCPPGEHEEREFRFFNLVLEASPSAWEACTLLQKF